MDDGATRHAREAVLLGPASVVRSSPHHGQSLSRMRPGAHRPFERPLRPEDSSAELGLSNSGAAKTFAQGARSQAISTPDARMDDGSTRQH